MMMMMMMRVFFESETEILAEMRVFLSDLQDLTVHVLNRRHLLLRHILSSEKIAGIHSQFRLRRRNHHLLRFLKIRLVHVLHRHFFFLSDTTRHGTETKRYDTFSGVHMAEKITSEVECLI
ncbi:hypothetical protein CFP56_029212 [Quercus suber]|uniref:Uncharacterized protein n=1 Tax=Quercus suber TaxID=58331 RepID=A0AAW0MAH6_QUESU